MGVSLAHITRLLLATRTQISCVSPTPFHSPLLLISGTQTARDLLVDDLDIRTAVWPPVRCVRRDGGNHGGGNHGGVVHRGFARRTRVLFERVSDFIEDHDKFVVAGHSMGGSCGVLMASLLVEMSKEVDAVYTFGMPRMASQEFRAYYRTTGLADVSRHFTTPKDPVVYRIPYVYDAVGDYETVPCDSDDAWVQHDMRSYYNVWNT